MESKLYPSEERLLTYCPARILLALAVFCLAPCRSRADHSSVDLVQLNGCTGYGSGYQVSPGEVLNLKLEPGRCLIEVSSNSGRAPRLWKFQAPTGQLIATYDSTDGRSIASFPTFPYGYGVYLVRIDDSPPFAFTLTSLNAPAELTVSGLEITPDAPAVGASVTVSGRFGNVGRTASGPFSWTLTSDDAPLASGRLTDLAAGQTSAILTWTGSLPPGAHQIAFTLDPAGEVTETFEVDNTRTQTLNVGSGAVDLVAELLADPFPAREGVPTRFTGRIRNQGTHASPPFAWRLTRSSAAVISGRHPSLAPGAVLSEPIQWTGLLPPDADDLPLGFVLEADSSFEIAESSEVNNRASLLVTVLPRTDLAVTALTVTPSLPIESGTLTVTGAIVNRGYEPFGPFSWTFTAGALPPLTGQAASLAPGAVLPVTWSGRLPAGPRGVTLTVLPGAADSFASNNARTVTFDVAPANCVPVKVTSAPQDLTVAVGRSSLLRATLTGTAPYQVVWYRGAVGDTSAPQYDEGPDYFPAPLYAPATYWLRAANACGTADARVATFALAPPAFTAAAVVNAASGAPGLVPGSLATLYGTGFTTQRGLQPVHQTPLPVSLTGTRLEINGRPAPLLLVADVRDGAQQLNFQVPWELTANAPATLTVFRDTAASPAVSVPVRAAQPGIFLTGPRAGAIVHADYRLVTPLNPARPGETLLAFVTGLGPVTVPPATGLPTTGATSTLDPVRVTLARQNAPVSYSGLAPGFVGLYQVNFEVPSATPPGEWPLLLTLATDSNEVTLAIQ